MAQLGTRTHAVACANRLRCCFLDTAASDDGGGHVAERRKATVLRRSCCPFFAPVGHAWKSRHHYPAFVDSRVWFPRVASLLSRGPSSGTTGRTRAFSRHPCSA